MNMNDCTEQNNKPIDIDSLVGGIKFDDSTGFDNAYQPSQNQVEDALTRLRSLQMLKEAKETSQRIRKINDAFANPAAKTGWGEDNLINATEYPMTRLTQDWQLLTSLYRSSWIVQRVCNIIPEDAL